MRKTIPNTAAQPLASHRNRLVSESFPASMPSDLPVDMRGMWLLKYYGPETMAQAIEEVLAYEATEGGLALGPDFLGFIEDYLRIAQYVATLDSRTVIVDVGCCVGLQQVFFHQFSEYIGIDQFVPACAKPLQTNARFLQGNFANLVATGKFVITDNMFGIANRSLLYQEGNEKSIKAFKQFRRLVMA